MNDTKSIIICGVGGQGILLAGGLLADACLRSGFDVKTSEVHGMAQRGGSVVTGVRYGKKVYSPLIGRETADALLAFERLEAVRNLGYLVPGGSAVVNDLRIDPLPVAAGLEEYPEDLIQILKEKVERLAIIDATHIAREVGNIRTANVVMLGGLARWLDIPLEHWHAAIEARVPPKTLVTNIEAFRRGYEDSHNHSSQIK
jgi:indolepyruvate ferredoxin oxidoreductase beta subunit